MVVEVLNAVLSEVLNQTDLTGALSLETAPAQLYVALHTNWPGAIGGPQTTNEMPTANWAAYGRKSLVRAAGAGGFTVDTADFAYNFDNVSFNQRTESSTAPVATHVSLGTRQTGAGMILWSSPLVDSASNWLYCIADGNGDFLGTADKILVAIGHAATPVLPVGGDPYEVAPVYGETLPNILSQSTRYFIKAAPAPAGTPPRICTCSLAITSGAGALVDFSAVNGIAAFQMIKAAPLTIIQNSIPTINSAAFRVSLSSI